MLSAKLDQLLLSLKSASACEPLPPAADRYAWGEMEPSLRAYLLTRADRALGSALPLLCYGDARGYYQGGRARYLDARRTRRELLKSLVLGCVARGGDEYLLRTADLVWLICEESEWADDDERELDEAACETAGLLATTVALLGREGPTRRALYRRVNREIKRRAVGPYLAGEAGFDSFETLENLLTAVLLSEDDDRSRWLCVRKAVRSIDANLRGLPRDGGFRDSLENHVRSAAALADCLYLIEQAAGGEVTLRNDPQFRNMARLPCALHLDGRWFANPGAGSPRPAITGDMLYHLGRVAGDADAMGLGAYLRRTDKRPATPFAEATEPLFRQAMYAVNSPELSRRAARAPMYPNAYLPEMRMLLARMGDFALALHGGAGPHRDVGNVLLFHRGEPVLIDLGGACAEAELHSLPTIDGVTQIAARAEDAQLADNGPYTLLSLSLSRAYPPHAQLTAWQRSWMLSPFEGSLRLIDAFGFEAAKVAAFHFITPLEPVLQDNRAYLGDVELRWEAGLEAAYARVSLEGSAARALGSGAVYRLTLKTIRPVAGGNYTFDFKARE